MRIVQQLPLGTEALDIAIEKTLLLLPASV
jgi:hypothetical protein